MNNKHTILLILCASLCTPLLGMETPEQMLNNTAIKRTQELKLALDTAWYARRIGAPVCALLTAGFAKIGYQGNSGIAAILACFSALLTYATYSLEDARDESLNQIKKHYAQKVQKFLELYKNIDESQLTPKAKEFLQESTRLLQQYREQEEQRARNPFLALQK